MAARLRVEVAALEGAGEDLQEPVVVLDLGGGQQHVVPPRDRGAGGRRPLCHESGCRPPRAASGELPIRGRGAVVVEADEVAAGDHDDEDTRSQGHKEQGSLALGMDVRTIQTPVGLLKLTATEAALTVVAGR